MKISYECNELIEELKKDIKEFGNIDMYAFFKKVGDYTVLCNYDFIEEEAPLNTDDFRENEIVQIMKAEDILKILEEQNRIL